MRSRHTRILVFAAALAGLCLFGGAGTAHAQSARDREEKNQSQPKKDEHKEDNKDSGTTVVVIHDGYDRGGGSSSTATFTPGRVPLTPRIAFISDRGGTPSVFIVWETGDGIQRLSRPAGADRDVTFSPQRGRLAYVATSAASAAGGTLTLMNADGNRVSRLGGLASVRTPAWSPDDQRIAFVSDRDGNPEIYVAKANGKEAARLTNSPGADTDPAFSPDGVQIAFVSDRAGVPAIYLMSAGAGSDILRVTPTDLPAASAPSFSPNGRYITFAAGGDIYVIQWDGKEMRRLTQGAGVNTSPVFNPDGDRIAFASNRGGSFAIYTMDLKGNYLRQITFGPSNDTHPTWW